MQTAKEFDPAKYLTKVGRADYLEVKFRLLWLRTLDPDAKIDTDGVRIDDMAAIFKATVTLTSGGSATGWGTVDADEWKDYVEKAETKALGRALAALGFGTQFTGDGEAAAAEQTTQGKRGRNANPANDDDRINESSIAALVRVAAANGWDRKSLETEANRLWQTSDLTTLNVGQGKTLYRWAQASRQAMHTA